MNPVGPIQQIPVHASSEPHFFRAVQSSLTVLFVATQKQIVSSAQNCYDTCHFCVHTIATTVESTVVKVHSLFMNTYAAVFESRYLYSAVTRILSLLVFDKGSHEKLEAARELVASDVNGDYYVEIARFLGDYVSQFLKSAMENGCTMPEEMRAPWLAELLWQKPDGSYTYTFKGQVLKALVCENQELLARYIELGLLPGFANFAKRIQTIQSQNQFALLDLTKELLQVAKEHIQSCDPAFEASSRTVVSEAEAIQNVIETALSIFLPKGAKDLELPVRDSMVKHVGPYLYSVIKTEVLPRLLEVGLEVAKTPYVKTLLLNEGLTLEKINIEREYHPLVPALSNVYPQQKRKELEELLVPCLQVGFNYVMPESNGLLKQAPGILAPSTAITMIEEMPKIHLQDIVRLALEKVAVVLDDGGAWNVRAGKRYFQQSEFRFEHTQEMKLYNDARLQEKTVAEQARLDELVRTTGADPQRLFQLFQSTLCRTNHAVYVAPSDGSESYISSALSRVSSFYGDLTKRVAEVLVQKGSVREFIRQLNQGIANKLLLAEHERVYVLFSECILKMIK